MNAPYVRTLHEYTCAKCGRKETVRWPWNPQQTTPDPMQSVPEGWTVVIRGDQTQTPVALCSCKETV